MSINSKIPFYKDSKKRITALIVIASTLLLILFFLSLEGIAVFLNLNNAESPKAETLKIFIQIIGGAVIIYGLWIANRRAKAMERTASVAESGNITERFKNAIEHLGSDKSDIRLGGIYALHRIAKESEEDRESICNIFCAYVRNKLEKNSISLLYKNNHYNDLSNIMKSKGEIMCIKSIFDIIFSKEQNIYEKITKDLSNIFINPDFSPLHTFYDYHIENTLLYNSKFSRCQFIITAFINTDFNVELHNSWFKECTFKEINSFINSSSMPKSNFYECTFENVETQITNLRNVSFDNKCSLKGLIFDKKVYIDKLNNELDPQIYKLHNQRYPPPKD